VEKRRFADTLASVDRAPDWSFLGEGRGRKMVSKGDGKKETSRAPSKDPTLIKREGLSTKNAARKRGRGERGGCQSKETFMTHPREREE